MRMLWNGTSAIAVLFVSLTLVSVGCVGELEVGYGEGLSAGERIPVTDDEGTTTGDASSDESTFGDSTGVRLDLPEPSGPSDSGFDPDVYVPNCNKIDFLFVVDNSGSMGDEQDTLAQGFPGFIEEIRSLQTVNDYHVMVVDTDGIERYSSSDHTEGETNDACYDECHRGKPVPPECSDDALTCDWSKPACNYHSCEDWNHCFGFFDQTHNCASINDINNCKNGGLGVARFMRSTVAGEIDESCGFTGGKHYFDRNQPNSEEAFACAAHVGTTGDGHERAVEAILSALSRDEKTFANQCNQGFLRDDAMLVITILTDEDDENSVGANVMGFWAGNLKKLKPSQDGSDIVVVSYHFTQECQEAIGYGSTPEDLEAFLGEMPNSYIGSICNLTTNTFRDAAEAISNACDDLPPAPIPEP